MRDPMKYSANDLENGLLARADDAWNAMSDDVRFAVKRRLFQMNAIHAIKEVGAYFQNGAWSITPYPNAEGFGELGLMGCKFIYDKLCEQDR